MIQIKEFKYYPIQKYKNERLKIKEEIKEILQHKDLPSTLISKKDLKFIEAKFLKKHLTGKHIYDLSEENRSLVIGDAFF